MNGVCPNCNSTIQVKSTVKRRDFLDCPNCGEPLEVKSLIPLILDFDMSEYEDEEEEYEII